MHFLFFTIIWKAFINPILGHIGAGAYPSCHRARGEISGPENTNKEIVFA